jgi:hypothetical protein
MFSLLGFQESGGLARPVSQSSNCGVSAEDWFASSLTRLPAEKEPKSSSRSIYFLLFLSNVQMFKKGFGATLDLPMHA